MKNSLSRLSLCILLSSMISGCAEYQWVFNETVIKTPETIYTAFSTEDNNLQSCLDQAIKDQAVTAPEQLTLLNCSYAGVKTLAGLDKFHNLKQINLSNNELRDIVPLGNMGRVEVLLLSNNKLIEAPELLTLPKLNRLEIDGNPNLSCRDVKQLKETFKGKLKEPDHC